MPGYLREHPFSLPQDRIPRKSQISKSFKTQIPSREDWNKPEQICRPNWDIFFFTREEKMLITHTPPSVGRGSVGLGQFSGPYPLKTALFTSIQSWSPSGQSLLSQYPTFKYLPVGSQALFLIGFIHGPSVCICVYAYAYVYMYVYVGMYVYMHECVCVLVCMCISYPSPQLTPP